MSDFAWTLIDIRRLRTLLIILFYKENVCVWDGINVVFCKESVDGMDGISTDLPFGVLVPMWQGKRREISILSCLRTELMCHLT